LLVVIGILVVLLGIVAYGLSKVIDHQKRAAARISLENMRSMLNEFEVATKGLTRQPAPGTLWWNGSQVGVNVATDIWHDANPTDGAASAGNLEPDPARAPAAVTKEMALDSTNPVNGRYNS